MRVMILAETRACTTAAVAAAAAVIDADCAHVTVVAVAQPRSPWSATAAIGNSCQVWCPAVSLDEELAQFERIPLAARAACSAAATVSESLPVRHCAAPDWRSAIRMACQYDLVVVVSPPSRIRDRRLLRGISRDEVRVVSAAA